jgi:hypothetical protein
MGRKKLDAVLIADDKSRNTTFKKRKLGLIKKAQQLTVLCGVPVSLVMKDLRNNVRVYANKFSRKHLINKRIIDLTRLKASRNNEWTKDTQVPHEENDPDNFEEIDDFDPEYFPHFFLPKKTGQTSKGMMRPLESAIGSVS